MSERAESFGGPHAPGVGVAAGRGARRRPVVGITMDVVETDGRVKGDCSLLYAQRVADAGGTPVMLPAIAELVDEHVALCDAVVLTGGDDPKMEAFGVATDPRAKVMHPWRQEYELRLLDALRRSAPDRPTLGVCLGMQLMCLHAGGVMDQHLPDRLATHARHKNAEHEVSVRDAEAGLKGAGRVWSNHRQAMVEAGGGMDVIARSDDGVIEAVRGAGRRWYVGVQWHPERTVDATLGRGVFEALLRAARNA